MQFSGDENLRASMIKNFGNYNRKQTNQMYEGDIGTQTS